MQIVFATRFCATCLVLSAVNAAVFWRLLLLSS